MDVKSSPILNEMRPLLPAYRAVIALGFFATILFLIPPLFAEQVGDHVSASRSEATLFVLFFIATFLVAIHSVLDVVRRQAMARISIDLDERIGRRLFDALHRAPTKNVRLLSTSTMQDFNTVRDFLSGRNALAVFDAVWSPLFIVVMAAVHWIYVVIFGVVLAIYCVLAIVNRQIARHQFDEHQKAAQIVNEFTASAARNSDSIRALGMISSVQARWHEQHTAMLGWREAGNDRVRLISSAMQFMHRWQMVLLYSIGYILYINFNESLSGMLVLIFGVRYALSPLLSIVTNWSSYASFAAAFGRLDDILRAAGDGAAKVTLVPIDGTLSLSRVFAAAPGEERIILHDISFSLTQGRILGIVGPNGAGKSCLARVIVGLWRPRRGSVAIGDHDLSHLDEDSLGASLGYLAQEIELLPGTVAENIARLAPASEIKTEKVIAAAELVGIQDLIRSLPNGYNTVVGPSGYVLSGGQRHRIALARAVYGNPNLVVLDEPNANLDAQGEQALIVTLQKLQSMGTTVVVITHRLNLLNYCDDILVLNGGTIQAYGSRELIASRMPRLRSAPALSVIEGTGEARRN